MADDSRHGPPLTPAEHEQLAELERRITADDPNLAGALGTGRPPRLPPRTVAALGAAAAALVLVAAVLGGLGGAASVALSLAGTALAWWLYERRSVRSNASPPRPLTSAHG